MSLNEKVEISLNRYEELKSREEVKKLEDKIKQLQERLKTLEDAKLCVIDFHFFDGENHFKVRDGFLGCDTENDIIKHIQKFIDDHHIYYNYLKKLEALEKKWYIRFFKMFSE